MDRKAELEKIIRDAHEELDKIRDAERIAILPKYIGKCFRLRGDYHIVTGKTKEGYLSGFSLERYGKDIEISPFDVWMVNELKRAKEITANQFWAAYDKAMASLLALRK
ncbi:MAG: hypothetical protein BWX54_01967 [Verrucomicrobia bacterium ADurb.Bin018]|nr:MAG: hypothetical protein BWX54_01967 [Verrucomicrobia bacterium ADurb.Bin018]